MSKRFWLIATFLLIVILIGMLGILMVYSNEKANELQFSQTVSCMCETSPFINTAIAGTVTAKSWTATPMPGPTQIATVGL